MQSVFHRVVLTTLLCVAPLYGGETIRCVCIKDTGISSAIRQEYDSNGGKSPRLRLKIYQEFALLDFDVAALKSKTIASATLHIAPADGAEYSPERGTDLRWFTLSTISTPWVEGEASGYARDDKGKGATFNEASYKTRSWCPLPDGSPAFPSAKVWDVILGNGNSLRCDVDGGNPKNGYFAIPVDKRLIEALISGTSHGLLVMDGSTGVDRNCTIFSRDVKKSAPYLTVTLAGEDKQPPAPPSALTVEAAPRDAQPDFGAARITLKVPDDCFALKAKLNGVELPRWMTPFPKKVAQYIHPAGTFIQPSAVHSGEDFILDFLPSNAPVKLEFASVDAAGNVSEFVTVSRQSSPSAKAAAPAVPALEWTPAGGTAPVLAEKLRVWAVPENCKVDPLNGKILYEPGMENAASKNAVWDARTRVVRVAAARGEIASVQIVLQTTGKPVSDVNVKVSIDEAIRAKLWNAWYVKAGKDWQQEYALPDGLAGLVAKNEKRTFSSNLSVSIPADSKRLSAQTTQVIVADLPIPAKSTAGLKSGQIEISLGDHKLILPLQLQVYSATIPDEIHFAPEFNCYSGPGEAGSEQFFDAHRLAHYHRTAINRVTHSHMGNFSKDLTPPANAEGRVTDWSAYDKNVGPLLEGSAFASNPRANVPVSVLYLPLFEGYPLNFKKNYNPGVVAKGKDWKAVHDIFAKPVEQCFPDSYRNAFLNCSEDFAKHALEKGWTQTRLQCFQNNKHQYARDGWTGTAWMMDEPNEYFDWRALNYYAALFHEGVARAKQPLPKFVYRADVSRPMWQGNVSDGTMNELYSGGDLFSAGYLCKSTRRRANMRFVAYGAANAQDRANHETTAWCLKSYIHEADGVVPWQSLGGDEAFDKAENLDFGNALIVDGRKRFNINAVASFRVHAFRSGAQLCELLRLLEIKNNWGRAHSGVLIQHFVPLASEFKQAFADDAAAVTFSGLNGDRFVELKETILKLLEK